MVVGVRTFLGFVMVCGGSVVAVPEAAQAANEPVIHFVIDVSGSMSGQKLTEAVEAIKITAEAVPDTTALGLRTYEGSCNQSFVEPLVPIGLDNDEEIIAAADSLVALGGTPTTAALGEGIDELLAYPSSGPKRLVLLTDGDTQCGISVCSFIQQKDLGGVQITLYTVGLQVSPGAVADLTCAAEFTGGSFIPADDPNDLVEALGQATGGGRVKVLALGDSYSAGVGGTGAPDVQDCWRRPNDSFSGQLVQMAQSAGRNIDYRNQACIGATTADIISRSQPGTQQSKQLDYVSEFQPDVITLTIGGNDIGFGPLARNCVINSLIFVWSCSVDAERVNLVDKQRSERASYDGLYDRLVATYVALRQAQGSEGHLYVLTYPTVFERSAFWDTIYQFSPRSLGVGNCNGFNARQARESNKLGTRLGDTMFLAVEAANNQVGNVHFVDWRNEVVTEGEGFLGRNKVRVAYNREGLCARDAPWDMNGLAFGDGQQFGKDSFHPTEQGYRNGAERLKAVLGW